jgi:CHAD domain-containing protein
VKTTSERELRLAADPGFRLPDLLGEPIKTRTFVSTYHDTPDLRLAASAITLRHRVEGRTGLWQLKIPQGEARLEVEVEGDAGAVPPSLAELLTAVARAQPVMPVAALRTERVGMLVRDGVDDSLVEVVRDSVVVLEGGQGGRFDELELELLRGDGAALRRVERLLRRAGAGDTDDRAKLFQVLDVPGPDAGPPDGEGAERLAAAIAAQGRAILANDPGTRLGVDPEHLHRHRVAVRRLRAMLRAARPMLDRDWADDLRGELGALGSVLGPVRDADVLTERLQAQAAQLGDADGPACLPLLQALSSERSVARTLMLHALRSPRYLRLLDRLDQAAAALPVTDPGIDLRDVAAAEYRKLLRDYRRLSEAPSDDALHALRIRAKRARYASELAAPDDRRWKHLITRTKQVQELLGEHQDAHVAEARLRELAGRTTGLDTHLAAGRLIEQERARRRHSRRNFPKAMHRLERAHRRAIR